MLIYLDLDTNRLVIGPGNASLVGGYATPRGSGPLLRVQPASGGQLVALPAGFEITWTVKEADDWGGDILAYAEDFVQESGTTVYSCAVNYETTALDALLGIGGTEVESVSLIAQLAWRPSSSDTWRPTQLVDLHLHNSIWRDVPGAPDVTPSSFDWLVDSLAASAGITLTEGVGVITIGLALTGGIGTNVTTSGANKVVAQDLQKVISSADQDFFGANPTVFVSDTDLRFDMVAGATYEVSFHTRFIANFTIGSRIRHQAQWSLPAGAVAYGSWQAPYIDAAVTELKLMSPHGVMSGIGDIFISDDATTEAGSWNNAIIVCGGTAGTAILQIKCANLTNTNKITRKAGSYLIARRIS